MDKYTLVIILTTVGFFALAAALLVPIWRFLNSEEARAEQWTRELSEQGASESELERAGSDGTRESAEVAQSGIDEHERR